MKNSFGNNIQVTLFGESHGEAIGVVIDGLAAGLALDLDHVQKRMAQRQAKGRISTQRHEPDAIRIVSGWFEGHTTGTPLTILIENTNTRSKDYERTRYRLRPSHADYTAFAKYDGFQDFRGGGHFSGRLTAPIVAAGAIAQQLLEQNGVFIGSHILRCHSESDHPFATDEPTLKEQILRLNDLDFPVLDEESAGRIHAVMEAAANDGDSVGGIIECRIFNLPAGLGDPVFDRLEAGLAKAMLSIGACKGFEYGLGFRSTSMRASEINDEMCLKDGKAHFITNNSGGILGGISTGECVTFRAAFKPTASISRPQRTVTKDGHETIIEIKGRHDPCIVPRAVVVVEAMAALTVADFYLRWRAYE